MQRLSLQGFKLYQRLALLVTTLCFSVAVILVTAGSLSTGYLLETMSGRHRTVLAEQLASRAAIAMVNNDRVSMRALLTDFITATDSSLVTVYDVTMQPLAQAGDPNLSDLNRYRAEILVDNAIAGYAVVSVSTQNELGDWMVASWTLLGLALLLSVFVFALATRSAQALVDRIQRITRSVRDLAPLEPAEAEVPDDIDSLRNELATLPLDILRVSVSGRNTRAATGLATLLHVQLNSLGDYLAKLDHPAIVAYLETLSPGLVAASRLYGGKLDHSRHASVSITFSGYHPSGDIYERCCYCAWLMRSLLQELESRGSLRYRVSMAALSLPVDEQSASSSYSAFLQEQLTEELAMHCKTQPHSILLANDIIESDSDQFFAELSSVSDFVMMTGLDSEDEATLIQQRDSILAHLVRDNRQLESR